MGIGAMMIGLYECSDLLAPAPEGARPNTGLARTGRDKTPSSRVLQPTAGIT